MLYFTLIVCGVYLLIANCVYPRRDKVGLPAIVDAIGFTFLMVCSAIGFMMMCMASLPAVLLQVIGLSVLWVISSLISLRPLYYRLATAGVTVLALVLAFFWISYPAMQREAKLVAFESIVERLPTPRIAERMDLSAATNSRLSHFNSEVADQSQLRERMIKSVHEPTMQTFVDSRGFGVTRMSGLRRDILVRDRYEREELPQPGIRDMSAETAGHGWGTLVGDGDESLQTFHQKSMLDFVNPRGFGYIKDRQQVAGFQSHRFSQRPENPKPWELQTLDLMGLVVHAEPTVYVSANLPRMDELKKVPTRAPDEFEAAGLEVLCKGEDLYMRESTPTLRLLGAIRAADKCVKCHGCERGDMLGAFSYTLRRPE